jgi:hypothetical protein
MRLTIIPKDYAVYIAGVPYSPLDMSSVPVNVHALQWFDTSGWIEFTNAPTEQITELPSWAITCVEEWEAADYRRKHPDPTTPSAEDNKKTALKLLSETDWAALPEVSDPLKSDPYLVNADEFNVYRNAVRKNAISPRNGVMDWPDKPLDIWQNVEDPIAPE